MYKNKILNEYLDEKNSIYSDIYSQIVRKNSTKKRLLSLVATLFIVVVLGTTTSSIYAKKNWDEEYKKYQERYINCANATIDVEEGKFNTKNLDMEYIYHDGFGIKLDSIFFTEHNCLIDVDIYKEEERRDCNAFEFSYAIYDEDNNIYAVDERFTFGATGSMHYKKKLCRELGLKYSSNSGIPKEIVNQRGLNPILVEDERNIMRLDLRSAIGFPKSKRIYIRIFDLGYALVNQVENDNNLEIIDAENISLSNSEWQFEIDIPEEFYYRTYTNLIPSDNIEGVDVIDAILSSESALLISINTEYFLMDIARGITILDEDGNSYTLSNLNDSDKSNIQMLFNLEKNVLNKKIYLNVDIPEHDINRKIELIKE